MSFEEGRKVVWMDVPKFESTQETLRKLELKVLDNTLAISKVSINEKDLEVIPQNGETGL